MHRMKKVGGGGVRSLSHSSSASGGKGRAGPGQTRLSMVTSPRDPFSFGVISERQHVGWPGS